MGYKVTEKDVENMLMVMSPTDAGGKLPYKFAPLSFCFHLPAGWFKVLFAHFAGGELLSFGSSHAKARRDAKPKAKDAMQAPPTISFDRYKTTMQAIPK